jgi:hypothetical protein
MSRTARARCARAASALILVIGIVLVVMSTVAFAQDDGSGDGGVSTDVATQNVPLHNNTANSTDCPANPDSGVAYWHFVISPNNGTYTFVTITLNVGGTTFIFTGSDIIPNGSQHDNVFIAVPSGKTLTDLLTSGSSADITPNAPPPNEFNLSGTCPASESTTTTTGGTTTSTSSTSTTSTSTTTTSTTAPTTTTVVSTTAPPTSQVSPTSVVASTTTTQVAGVVVTVPPATGSLAFTGSSNFALPMAVVGALMILAGLGLAFFAQRRFA